MPNSFFILLILMVTMLNVKRYNPCSQKPFGSLIISFKLYFYLCICEMCVLHVCRAGSGQKELEDVLEVELHAA